MDDIRSSAARLLVLLCSSIAIAAIAEEQVDPLRFLPAETATASVIGTADVTMLAKPGSPEESVDLLTVSPVTNMAVQTLRRFTGISLQKDVLQAAFAMEEKAPGKGTRYLVVATGVFDAKAITGWLKRAVPDAKRVKYRDCDLLALPAADGEEAGPASVAADEEHPAAALCRGDGTAERHGGRRI